MSSKTVAPIIIAWDDNKAARTKILDGTDRKFSANGTVEFKGKVYRWNANEFRGSNGPEITLRHLTEAKRGQMIPETQLLDARAAVLAAYMEVRKAERAAVLAATLEAEDDQLLRDLAAGETIESMSAAFGPDTVADFATCGIVLPSSEDLAGAARLTVNNPENYDKSYAMRPATDAAMERTYSECIAHGMTADCDGMSATDLMLDQGYNLEARHAEEGQGAELFAWCHALFLRILPGYAAARDAGRVEEVAYRLRYGDSLPLDLDPTILVRARSLNHAINTRKALDKGQARKAAKRAAKLRRKAEQAEGRRKLEEARAAMFTQRTGPLAEVLRTANREAKRGDSRARRMAARLTLASWKGAPASTFASLSGQLWDVS